MLNTPSVEWCLYPEQREKIEGPLMRALFYAPSSIHVVCVRYDGGIDDLASTSVLPEYRTANIAVGSGFFADAQDERSVVMLHEVLHQQVETLAVVFDDLLKAAVADEDAALHKWAKDQWRRAEESLITDLARRIHARESLIPDDPSLAARTL